MKFVPIPLTQKELNPQTIAMLNEIIAGLVYQQAYTTPDFGHDEPVDNLKISGMLAYADGVNWNPVNGAGFHRYDGSAWRQMNGYHDRGDPSTYDVTLGALTTDAAWHDLTLSAIPTGSKAVYIRVRVQDDAVGSNFLLRKNGNTNELNTVSIRNLVANQVHAANLIVPCDTNRVIEYKADNVVWSDITLTVAGWWI